MSLLLYVAGKLSPKTYYRISSLRYKLPFVGQVFSALGNRIRNRDGVIQQGIGKGLKFNVGDCIAGSLLGTIEPQMQDALQRVVKPGMVAFDLGANVGFLTLLFTRLVGPTGKVFSFEPLEKNAKRIKYNAAQNQFANVTVRQEAVGKEDGTVVFRIADFSTNGRMEEHQPGEHTGIPISVPLRCLDSVIARCDAPEPDIIKMDIEGAEADCLRGAKKLLAGKRPLLLIEIHDKNKEVDELLTAAHYRVLVLGSKQTLIEGHWNVQILAFPEERPLSQDVCDAVTTSLI